jgi:hypothetical protein
VTHVNPIQNPSDARALLELGLSADSDDALLLDAVADRLPGLEILEVIGRGGMGVVYRARQASLDRDVAIKVLDPDLARRPHFAARFEQEAKTLATLHHPGIVMVHDVGEADGLYYLVMEYVRGHNVREELTEPMSTRRVAAMLTRLCEVLSYSHAKGVIHRDIKPENILVDPSSAIKVADFGLAKLVHGPRLSLTSTLTAIGTLPYMAPEQIEGRPDIDARTDVYAVGVLAFELLTTRLPVGRFGPPSTEGALGAELDDVVMRCLERDPDRRFASMAELSAAIGDAIAGRKVATRPQPPRRKRAPELLPMLVLNFVVLALVGLGVAAAIVHGTKHRATSTEADDADAPAPISPVRECITAAGTQTCGYNCKSAYGRAICAEKPDMECVAHYGQLECGYGCVAAYGRIECADDPRKACMKAGHGTIACGYDCEERGDAVVCKDENPEAPVLTRE